MRKIINLTQHAATKDQQKAGVVDIADSDLLAGLHDALTFQDPPSKEELDNRARYIAELACLAFSEDGNTHPTEAMIGGAPFFMSHLERALKAIHIRPLYAFSRREVVETKAEDGGVQKTAIFKHIDFIES